MGFFEVTILRRTLEGEDDDPFSIRFHRRRTGGFRIGVELWADDRPVDDLDDDG